jgi:YD repeat-containing protein
MCCVADCLNALIGAGPTGAQAYLETCSYDVAGDRNASGEVDYPATGSSNTTKTTDNYTNGATPASTCSNTAVQPHTLTSLQVVGSSTVTTGFCYDQDGDMVSRTPTTGSAQTLSWNDQGELASITDGSGSSEKKTSFVYSADGTELIRRDPTQTTLFVGDTEIFVNTSTSTHTLAGAVRYYTLGGSGSPVAPVLGRFISADPVFEVGSPQQMGGFTYAADIPVAGLDPGGLVLPGGFSGGAIDSCGSNTRCDMAYTRDFQQPDYAAMAAAELEAQQAEASEQAMYEEEEEANARAAARAARAGSGGGLWGELSDTLNQAAQVMNVVALATCWVPGLDEVTATAAITLDVASGLVNAGLAYSQGDYLSGTEALAGTAMMAIPGAESATGDATRALTDDAGPGGLPDDALVSAVGSIRQIAR